MNFFSCSSKKKSKNDKHEEESRLEVDYLGGGDQIEDNPHSIRFIYAKDKKKVFKEEKAFKEMLLNPNNLLKEDDILKLEEIGKGGFGIVWKAFSRSNETYVALKYLTVELNDSSQLENLFNEISIFEKINNLQHNSFIKFFGIFRESISNNVKQTFIIMQEFGLANMRKVLNIRKKYKNSEIVPKIIELLDGLNIAEKNGIVHGDLKPENLVYMFDKNLNKYVFKFIDFGCSKILDSEKQIIEYEKIRGYTDFYAAPEILKQNKSFNPFKADVYSMGILILKILKHSEENINEFKKNPNKRANFISEIAMENEETSKFYEIVFSMINEISGKRPSFSELQKEFNALDGEYLDGLNVSKRSDEDEGIEDDREEEEENEGYNDYELIMSFTENSPDQTAITRHFECLEVIYSEFTMNIQIVFNKILGKFFNLKHINFINDQSKEFDPYIKKKAFDLLFLEKKSFKKEDSENFDIWCYFTPGATYLNFFYEYTPISLALLLKSNMYRKVFSEDEVFCFLFQVVKNLEILKNKKINYKKNLNPSNFIFAKNFENKIIIKLSNFVDLSEKTEFDLQKSDVLNLGNIIKEMISENEETFEHNQNYSKLQELVKQMLIPDLKQRISLPKLLGYLEQNNFNLKQFSLDLSKYLL